MARALSVDLRQRAVAAYKRGDGRQADIAARFGIGESSLRRWLRRSERSGDLAPTSDYRHGPPPKFETADFAVLEELLRAHPDATNQELADWMAERTGTLVSASTISRCITLLNWTRKKSASSLGKPTPRVFAVFVRAGSDEPQS